MAKSKCLECGAAFDQTPGKREKKFCKPACRVNYCQKQKRLKSKITPVPADKASFDGKKGRLDKNATGKVNFILDEAGPYVMAEYPVKKGFKAPTDKHGAGKIVKEAVQKKEVRTAPSVSNFLEQRRKQKLG